MSTYEGRREYRHGTLDVADVTASPLDQLRKWLDEAIASQLVDEPYAMTLATASSTGLPSARVVLLRAIVEAGLIFYTNYQSSKGRQLADNPHVAAVFYWPALERQVRVEGNVERIDAAISDAYFASRPHESKVGAHVSQQSSVLDSREQLEREYSSAVQRFPEGSRVPRPEHWGGYCISPTMVEFWQGRPARLHDRVRYTGGPVDWTLERLAP